MQEFSTSSSIREHLRIQKEEGRITGFVPTMGALHEGHLSLIKQAKKEVDHVICSIFVNPLQFNRKEDLQNYPDRMNQDKEMLKSVNCDCLFIPSYKEVYPNSPQLNFDFGSIGIGMEADYRPKHFDGVAAVIKRFIEILIPDKAYFGEKDYQQLAIVNWLVKTYNLSTKIIGCQTVRAENGLAMSSRNYLLSDAEREKASKIYETLLFAKHNKPLYSPKDLSKICFDSLSNAGFKLEYFTIADDGTMNPITYWSESESPRAFVAAYLSKVRLIDNLSLNV